ncbi:MAG TPA: hypothetical protein EYG86_09075 [Crocinitomicaceae bacterium]|nr:hypothetical protein [Crocinitomicaceae bacterium]
MNRQLINLIIAFSFVGVASQSCSQAYSGESSQENNETHRQSTSTFIAERKIELENQKRKAKQFLANHKNYSQEIIFLLDMRHPSQNHRFFVLDLSKDIIAEKGLVAHGSGSVIGDSLVFSNIPESYQSSLGRYRIGTKYTGNFGKSYKLHGLDKTNNNAFKRYIVLHPYSCVPDEEQDFPICESLGCAMVSNNFMKTLYSIIDTSSKPILMVMYY